MLQYLTWALIIFVPLWIISIWLMKSAGFRNSFIIYLTTMGLLMISFFPFLVFRLGTVNVAIIYILFGIAATMFIGWKFPQLAWQGELETEPSPGHEEWLLSGMIESDSREDQGVSDSEPDAGDSDLIEAHMNLESDAAEAAPAEEPVTGECNPDSEERSMPVETIGDDGASEAPDELVEAEQEDIDDFAAHQEKDKAGEAADYDLPSMPELGTAEEESIDVLEAQEAEAQPELQEQVPCEFGSSQNKDSGFQSEAVTDLDVPTATTDDPSAQTDDIEPSEDMVQHIDSDMEMIITADQMPESRGEYDDQATAAVEQEAMVTDQVGAIKGRSSTDNEIVVEEKETATEMPPVDEEELDEQTSPGTETVPADLAPVPVEDMETGLAAFSLNDLIDLGFQAKMDGDNKTAIAAFSKAMDKNTDQYLQFLLGNEVAQIYIESGYYSRAIEILCRVQQMVDRPDLGAKINNDVYYYTAVKEMLERINLPGLPLSKIPRFIRIEAQEMAKAKLTDGGSRG